MSGQALSPLRARPAWGMALVLTLFGGLPTPTVAQDPEGGTRVVILGTGNPNSDPDRWGPAVAVVVGGQAYLVDAGAGVVRRAAAAARIHDLPLTELDLKRVFITHLHSDHTLGLPDLMFSPWVLGRPEPLEVYGPPGLERMAHHLLEAWREDIDMRLFGLEPQPYVDGYSAVIHESRGGLIYEDEHVRVEAIPVSHGSWPYSFGYRFQTADRTIVISGDARPGPSLIEACNGCDVLVHEVYSSARFPSRPPEWQTYHSQFHTSTDELAEIATAARPGLLLMYHQLFWGDSDEDLEGQVRAAGYSGRVVSARDLEVY